MRVTLVSPFDPRPPAAERKRAHVGGVERVFAEVSRGLAKRGHDVTIICSTDGTPGRTVEDGVTIVRRKRSMTVMRSPVARLWEAIEPGTDLVHVAATYPFTTPRVLQRAKELRMASILDFHFEPAPGSLVGRLGAGVYQRWGPRAYPLADAVLVRSRAYAVAAPSLRGVPSERWRVVPNGIDTERFHCTTKQGGTYLLFVGRLVPYKGLDVLLRALALQPVSLPLKIAGDGPMRAKWEALAKRLGVNAEFLGHVDDAHLPELYAGARLTILPSVTRQEAFGIALLESMACGTPVVAADLPGVAEVAHAGGLTARTGDPASFAKVIHEALESAQLPRGPELARRIRAQYSWDAVTERLLEVYEEVLDRRSPEKWSLKPEVTTPADPRRHPVL